MKGKPLTPDMLEPPGTTLTVLVDGIRAKCVIGPFSSYSIRVGFFFEEKHPEYGEEFVTKHFGFVKPGVVGWGYDGKTMKVSVLDEKNPFDKRAAAHGFGFSPEGPEDYDFEWVEKDD